MAQIKVFSFWCLLFLIPIHLSSQSEQAIEVKEAYKYFGETKIVCGKRSEEHTSELQSR